MAAATLQDVADKAGVHVATASRALNPATRDKVSPRTLRRVLAAAEKLNYRSNTAARMLRTRRSQVIGILVPDILNPLYAAVVRGAEQVLTAHGYTSLILNTDNDPEIAARHFRVLQDWQADGFIFGNAYVEDPLITAAAEAGVPMVLMLRSVAGLSVPFVNVDERLGIRLAVDHLVGLGHTRIGHVPGPPTISTAVARLEAFQETMAAHGIEVPPGAVVAARDYTAEAGEEAAERLVASDPALTAVVAGNDLLALGLISGLARHGRQCPRDVSVVGFNDMPLADRFAPPLTTIRTPQREVGAEAARTLLRGLADDDAVARSIELTPQIVVRGSTTAPRADG